MHEPHRQQQDHLLICRYLVFLRFSCTLVPVAGLISTSITVPCSPTTSAGDTEDCLSLTKHHMSELIPTTQSKVCTNRYRTQAFGLISEVQYCAIRTGTAAPRRVLTASNFALHLNDRLADSIFILRSYTESLTLLITKPLYFVDGKKENGRSAACILIR